MSLRTEFEKNGSWLFNHRSLLPLMALPVILGGLTSYHFIDGSHALTECGQIIGLLVSIVGLSIRIITIGYVPEGTSGRNTTGQVADKLNTTGIYSLVRHPLYLGNYLVMLGVALALHSFILTCLTSCLFWLFYERIMFAEEAFLRQRFGETFEQWSDRTPAVIPRLTGWVQPPLPFCWRTVLRREYTGVMIIATLFFLIDFIGDSFVEGHMVVDWKWIILLGLGLGFYFTLRTLKKTTSLLHVKGR